MSFGPDLVGEATAYAFDSRTFGFVDDDAQQLSAHTALPSELEIDNVAAVEAVLVSILDSYGLPADACVDDVLGLGDTVAAAFVQSAIDAFGDVFGANVGQSISIGGLAVDKVDDSTSDMVAIAGIGFDEVEAVSGISSSANLGELAAATESGLISEADVGFVPDGASRGVSTHGLFLTSAAMGIAVSARGIQPAGLDYLAADSASLDDNLATGILGCDELVASTPKLQPLRFIKDEFGATPDPWHPPGYPEGEAAPCTDDEIIVAEDARDWAIDHVDRLPRDFTGEDYQSAIAAALPGAILLCGSEIIEGATAAYSASAGLNTIFLQREFFLSNIVSDALGPDSYRGSVVVHEMTHLVDNEVFEKPFTKDKPSCGPPDCPEANEYRAAFIQMKALSLSDCSAEAAACAYYRTQTNPGAPDLECGQSGLSSALRALGEVFDCLLLPSGAVVVTIALAGGIIPGGILGLAAVIGLEVAALIVGIALGLV